MADSIRVTLTPDKLIVQPDGTPVESVITIQNTGAAVDQYAVELDQLPTTWYSLANTSVALFPQDKEDAKLVLHPPKGGTAKAGTYPFTVTVLSRADPSVTTRVEGSLQIGSVSSFELSITPSKVVGRKGRYTITMRNGGNADLEVELEGTDGDGDCRYGFEPKQVSVEAGAKATAQLDVRARRFSLVGARKQFDIQVRATPRTGSAKTVNAQFMHTPMFRTWRPIRRVIILLVLLLVIIGALAAVGGMNGLHNRAQDLNSATCSHLSLFCSGSAAPMSSQPPPTPVGAQQHGAATFVDQFRAFHLAAPKLVGQPLENENTMSQIATQLTTNGLLLFDHKSGHAFLVGHDATVWEFHNNRLQQVR